MMNDSGHLEPVVTYEQFINRFPRSRSKSKESARRLLPLYPSSDLAQIVAALMTDGHVEWYKSGGRARAKKVVLYSSEKEECEWFLKACKRVFGVEGRLIPYVPKYGVFRKQPYKACIGNAVVAMLTILAGAPAGDKTKIGYRVPVWIMTSGKEIKEEFLRAVFNFEGSVPQKRTGRPCSWRIGLYISKKDEYVENGKEFLCDIKNLLGESGVTFSGPGVSKAVNSLGKSNVIYITTSNQMSVINFYRHIGYHIRDKQEKLERCVVEIRRLGRIRSDSASDLLMRAKGVFGTDAELAIQVNAMTEATYTDRCMEHFRRKESKMPYEVLFAAIRLTGNTDTLDKLPEHVRFLHGISVPSRRV